MISQDQSQPPDICLLLRAYAEQRWLTSELEPHLRELERPHAVPESQLGAALAYLEVLWLDARQRARETDARYDELAPEEAEESPELHECARRYYGCVRRLRREMSGRVRALTEEGSRRNGRRRTPSAEQYPERIA